MKADRLFIMIGIPSNEGTHTCEGCNDKMKISDNQNRKIEELKFNQSGDEVAFLCVLCWALSNLPNAENVTNIDVGSEYFNKETIH